MDGVKVSIIVPVYNVEKYLKRCLDSLINQTLKDIEIICVNDNSPDNSINILREYETLYPEKIAIIDSPVNLRQGGARNLGINRAQGEYIAFVDSDDWVKSDMFEKLLYKTRGSKYEIVYCNYQTAKTTEGPYNIINRTELVNWEGDTEAIKKQLLIKPSSIWSAIYSRHLFFDYNIFFPERLFYEDNYIVPLLVAHADSIQKVDEPLIYYYTGNISITRSFNNDNFFDRVKTARLLLEAFRERDLTEYKEEIEFFFIEVFLVNTTIGCLRKFYPIRFKELISLRKEIKEILPKFYQNGYLVSKMNTKIEYKIYLWILVKFPYLLLLIYYPLSIYRSLKMKEIYN